MAHNRAGEKHVGKYDGYGTFEERKFIQKYVAK